MTTLWLVYQQNNQQSQRKISRELRSEGFDVKPVDIGSTDFTTSGTPDADLVIVHLHPDVPAAWGAYMAFKHRHPDFPALVFMHHHAVNSLKGAIDNVLGRKRRYVLNYAINSQPSTPVLSPDFRLCRINVSRKAFC